MSNQMDSNSFQGEPKQSNTHFFLIPFMAQGHMIPMVDLARLLAGAGALVTFITTPVNSARIRPSIDRMERSGLPIHFLELYFPSAEAGLPAGCENLDLVPSPDLFKSFFHALRLLGPELKLHLTTGSPPDCIIFDSLNSWISPVAKFLGIPQLIFYGPSCFFILCCFLLKNSRVLETISDRSELFSIPGLPEAIKVTKPQVTRWIEMPGWEKLRDELYAADELAVGVVMNTFEELERIHLEKYRKETGKIVWPIGPLSLVDKDEDIPASRGRSSSIDTQLLVNWLESKPPRSVLFVSFGSIVCNPFSQLVEIGQGLESLLSSSLSLSFIWVVKEAEKIEDGENWLSEFEGRVERRGMVIRGWAPQAVILSHVAVGGFMTHCGWNSILESVAAGVVMATWPRFADQFLNEKLVVEVLKVGVAVGAKVPTLFGDETSENAQMRREEVRKAAERVMDGGMEGEEMRWRARELREKARKAMEVGGSSFENLKEIIQFFKGKN